MTRDELEIVIADAIAADRDDWTPEKNRSIARTALSAIESAGVTLCPIEPTDEMQKEGADYLPVTPGGATNRAAGDVYKAMLSASPLKQGRET